MLYTFPHYYGKFKCIAGECEDTCCAGWEIMIDNASLKRYRREQGPIGNRLANSINWKDGSFLQYEHRCAFLNEDNLCDLYTELGPDSLCRTCKTYPRHIEEFEGCREYSLCLSCIEAAKLILGCREKVRFLTREDEREENYEEFDFFLYTKLMDARELALEMLQQRSLDWRFRVALCLGLAHDLQARIVKGRLFEADKVCERYRGEKREQRLRKGLKKRRLLMENEPEAAPSTRFRVMLHLFEILEAMEPLKKDWPEYRNILKSQLFAQGEEAYRANRAVFLKSPDVSDLPLWSEQLMVYFVFTYFCGAVYDENPYGKMKMAASCVLLIEEMVQALWLKDGTVSFETVVEAAHRFSREVEHSDENRKFLEERLCKREEFGLSALLSAVLG